MPINTLDNYLKEPANEKYQRINLSHAAFVSKVGNVLGGKKLLEEAGFKEKVGFFVMKNKDMERVKEFIATIEANLKNEGELN